MKRYLNDHRGGNGRTLETVLGELIDHTTHASVRPYCASDCAPRSGISIELKINGGTVAGKGCGVAMSRADAKAYYACYENISKHLNHASHICYILLEGEERDRLETIINTLPDEAVERYIIDNVAPLAVIVSRKAFVKAALAENALEPAWQAGTQTWGVRVKNITPCGKAPKTVLNMVNRLYDIGETLAHFVNRIDETEAGK